MRRIYLLLIFSLILTFKLEGKRIEGKIIFENDTLFVTFNIPFKSFGQEIYYEKLQSKIKYYNASGDIIVLKPDKAKEIQFKYKSDNVRMLSRNNTLGLGSIFSTNSNIFLKLEIDGRLKLFNYFFTQRSPGTYNATTGMTTGGFTYGMEKYILQKEEDALFRPISLTFRKDMVEYFRDCPALVERIENKDFRMSDLGSIVSFYNLNCQQ
jgi:hypothetical protein